MILRLIIFLLFIPIFSYSQIYSVTPEPRAARGAFGFYRVAEPRGIFNGQFTYDELPLIYDTITVGTGTAIAYDATDRNVNLSFTASPTTSQVALQSFEHIRYQPGKSQLALITFNMNGGTANVTKYAGYSDGENGIEFLLDGTTPKVRIMSNSGAGDETVTQSSWNIDKFDGTGPSKITLDLTKTQILVIDFQALYVGSVRIGFDINGIIYYAHQFNHANLITSPYIQTANLPIRVGMSSSGTVTSDMDFICASVISEGGQEDNGSYHFAVEGTGTAGNNTDVHILSIQPDTLFKGLTNRQTILFEGIDLIVTGNTPVRYSVVLGQGLTGQTATNVSGTYSGVDAVTGTLSGTAPIIIDMGYCAATAQTKSSISKSFDLRYPITLDHSGAVRNLGRISVLAYGIGNTSALRVVLKFKIIR